jgi:hypothetical protein
MDRHFIRVERQIPGQQVCSDAGAQGGEHLLEARWPDCLFALAGTEEDEVVQAKAAGCLVVSMLERLVELTNHGENCGCIRRRPWLVSDLWHSSMIAE